MTRGADRLIRHFAGSSLESAQDRAGRPVQRQGSNAVFVYRHPFREISNSCHDHQQILLKDLFINFLDLPHILCNLGVLNWFFQNTNISFFRPSLPFPITRFVLGNGFQLVAVVGPRVGQCHRASTAPCGLHYPSESENSTGCQRQTPDRKVIVWLDWAFSPNFWYFKECPLQPTITTFGSDTQRSTKPSENQQRTAQVPGPNHFHCRGGRAGKGKV